MCFRVSDPALVGTGADTSFARTVQITSASTETGWVNWGVNSSHQWDADRHSDVTHLTGEDALGKAYWESGSGWDIQGKRTFAIWAKTPSSGSVIAINYIDTASNRRLIAYVPGTGTDYTSGAEGFIYLGGTAQDFDAGGWVRIERDLQSDITARFSGTTLQRVTGIYARPGTSSTLDIDDLSFSNSLTVEHNTLGGGVIGHILRNRSTNSATYAVTDRWFHYDQVGSVMAETDSTGALAQTHHQDAFGNTQASWSTGLWGGDKPGWHHNTKEYDGDIGLVYMYSRFYNAETGTFGSRAPMPPMAEHQYSTFFAPPSVIDPLGLFGLGAGVRVGVAGQAGIAGMRLAEGAYNLYWLYGNLECYNLANAASGRAGSKGNAIRHCTWMCCLTKHLGAQEAWNIGISHEAAAEHPHTADSHADGMNNRAGIGIACAGGTDCESSCRQAYRNGQLWIVGPNKTGVGMSNGFAGPPPAPWWQEPNL